MSKSKIRLSIRWKIFLLVGTLITVGVLFVLMRTSDIFKKDKTAFVKELNQKLAASTTRNIINRISSIQDKLVIFISSKESLSQTGIKLEDQLPVLFSRYSDFLAIGFLKPQGSEFKTAWILRNPLSASKNWPADSEQLILKQVNFEDGKESGKGFWKGTGPDGNPVIVFGFGVQVSEGTKSKQSSTAWIVGILPSTVFDDFIGEFSAGLNTAFLIDSTGVAIAHSDSNMAWKDLKQHPMVAEILKGQLGSATGDYKDPNGRDIIGSYETIPNMNFTMVLTTPRDKAFEAANVLLSNILVTGGGILLLALCAAIILANLLTNPLQKLTAAAAQIGAGDFKVHIDVKTSDEIGDLAESFMKMEKGLLERDEALEAAQTALVQSEKMSAFGQLSAGIAHEVKNPLAGILGHAQLAMGKIQNDDLKKHLEVIEKETRRCKTIVENLMKFARQEKASMTPTDLATVIQDTINLVDHQLSLAGCKIAKDIQPCPQVDANANQLQQVLLNLMVNASHAMEKAAQKVVTVRLVHAGNKAQIQVQDTGSGIPPEIQKKIFEPFFTTKPAGKGTGLGLAVSIGIVKEHKGEIYIKSEVGQGTTFFIDIPISGNATATATAETKKPAKAAAKPKEAEVLPTSSTVVATSMGPAPTMARNQPPPSIMPTSMGPAPSMARNQPPPSIHTEPQKEAPPPTMESRVKGDEEFFTSKKPAPKVDLPPMEEVFFGTQVKESKAPEKPAIKPQSVKDEVSPPAEAKSEVVAKEEAPEMKKASSDDMTDTEFKVKVKRPKIKGTT